MEKSLLSPTNDYVFKLLFGDKRNTDILAGFLKSVLNISPDEYKKLTIVDPFLKREDVDEKAGILDVKLQTKNGNVINYAPLIVKVFNGTCRFGHALFCVER